MIGRQAFRDRLDRLWDLMKAIPAAPGVDEVLVPGELEEQTKRARAAFGIPLPRSTWRELEAEATRTGIALPAPV